MPVLNNIFQLWSAMDRAKAYLEARLPNSQAEFFSGHMMFWEYPERFNSVLEEFLSELG